MFRSNRFIALDIGASKVTVAEFLADRSGVPQLVNYGVGSLGIESEAETDVSAYIVATIREVLRENRMKPAPLGMTISGQAVFPRYVKLPPVSRDKILQIVHYEAEQNVPFPIDEVVWDYQLIDNPADEQLNVMLVAVKTENITKLTDCVLAVGLEPEIVDVAPMALYNCTRYNYPDLEGCTMVLDIGARSSNLIFVEENKIFSRSIPVAGNAITQEIMKEFEVSFAEAEDLKQGHAMVALGGVYAGPDNEVADRVSKIVRNVITRLHAEVNRSINFYRSQQGGSHPLLVLLTGGSSIIPHMDTFFREKLKVPVEYLNPFVNIAVGPQIDAQRVSEDLHLLGEVSGLALRRALSCPVEVNLMPPELVSKKVFRKRQPFFALAALGLVLIMLCWWVYFIRMREMLDRRAEKVEERTGDLKGLTARLNAVTKGQDGIRKRVDRLVGVVEHRTRWNEIINTVRACMLDGMWLTELRPVREGNRITEILISGRGFLDVLDDGTTDEALAFEQLAGRLTESKYFTAETRVKRMSVVTEDDFAREFTVQVVLAEPMGEQ